MFWWLILILFSLSGYFMKLSDNLYDDYNKTWLACIAGIFCAIVTALLITNNVDAVYIFSAITAKSSVPSDTCCLLLIYCVCVSELHHRYSLY